MKYIHALYMLVLLTCSSSLVAQNSANGVELKNLEKVNTELEDFAPMPYGNKLMYAQAKRADKIFGPQLYKGSEHFYDLVSSSKNNEGEWQMGKSMGEKVNYKFSDGVVSFDQAGTKMYYTRNDLDGKNKRDSIVAHIYEATGTNGDFNSDRKLSFNMDLYSHMHPSLSFDGKTLYFTSDRPGGYGGMDIWMAEKKADGTFGTPKNLGAGVNTPDNEVFPYIDSKNNFFYSSDKSGNFDVLVARNVDGDWQYYKPLPAPFNSAADDLNYVANADGTEGYIASARGGGKGLDDIYVWNYTPEELFAKIVVIDEVTKERLETAKVAITPTKLVPNILDELYSDLNLTEGNQEDFLTDANGGIAPYRVFPESEYNITASKEGYDPKTIDISTLTLTENDEYIVLLKPQLVEMTITVEDELTGDPIEGSTVVFVNKKTGETINKTTGPEGKITMMVDPNHNFRVDASKPNYTSNGTDMTNLLKEFADKGKIERVISLSPLTLVHVYFDFDESTIRMEESLEDLNNLKALLNRNPDFHIQLRGHTDARGSNTYNEGLSQRRADAVKDWLIGEGISKDRLEAKGFGETMLVNNCSNRVKCTEKEHQENRRTEFKVLVNGAVKIDSKRKSNIKVDPCKGCPF